MKTGGETLAEEPKTEAVPEERRREAYRFLEPEIWSKIPKDLLGRGSSHEEQEEILGYGPEGV